MQTSRNYRDEEYRENSKTDASKNDVLRHPVFLIHKDWCFENLESKWKESFF